MRGARGIGVEPAYCLGIIPADAGSTVRIQGRPEGVGDHPRGCGEHVSVCMAMFWGAGSSPRMRGAPFPGSRVSACIGIIPADAGSTHPGDQNVQISQDHPRGCGEHAWMGTGRWRLPGSSPRMRGAPHLLLPAASGAGIIPADAGSTATPSICSPLHQDHPRGCGEHLITPHDIRSWRGSSPRMRGARHPILDCRLSTRIIPADAGSTSATFARVVPIWDHPRGCGEHSV